MMNQIRLLKRERFSTRNGAEKREKPPLEEPVTGGLRGPVAPGILSRFMKLFNPMRAFNGRPNDSPDIFSYTPSQNPDEFLENLRNNSDDCGWDRCATVEISSVPPDEPKPTGHTRFVCISDTHATHKRMRIPDGDVLLHCGDITERGTLKEVLEFNDWLGCQPHKYKIVIAGNHDIPFDRAIMERVKHAGSPRFRRHRDIPESMWKDWQGVLTNCIYLEDSEVTINGIRIYGSPWQPNFGGLAFNLKRGQQILEKWNKIPEKIDILMTHGPPAGRLDRVKRGTRAGCVDLLNTVQLRVKPNYHIFGHIHDDYGMESDGQTKYINCSAVNEFRNPVHPAIVFDYRNSESDVDGGVCVTCDAETRVSQGDSESIDDGRAIASYLE